MSVNYTKQYNSLWQTRLKFNIKHSICKRSARKVSYSPKPCWLDRIAYLWSYNLHHQLHDCAKADQLGHYRWVGNAHG